MKEMLYEKLKEYFHDAKIDFNTGSCNLDIYIPVLNLGIVFDVEGIICKEKVQIVNLVESKKDIFTQYQKIYYENSDFDLLWNSVSLFLIYNFDSVLWKNKITIP